MPSPNDPIQSRALARRIRHHRLAAGLTVTAAAKASSVVTDTFTGWEQGHHMPLPWRLATIAAALGVPVAALLTDELVLAEVRVSAETLALVRSEGAPAARAAAERIARNLEALLLAEATRPPVDTSPGARPKRRRTRAEVLAGTRAATEARKRKRGGEGGGRIE